MVVSTHTTKKTNSLARAFLACVVLMLAIVAPGTAHAATLSVSPSQGTYVSGSLIPLDIIVESGPQVINAVSGTIVLPPLVTPTSVDLTDSIIDIWITKPTASGPRVSFEGLILNPGLTGTGKIARIYLRVTGEGSATIDFDTGSVLANDGRGTNVLDGFSGAALSLKEGQQEAGDAALPDGPPTDIIDIAARIRPPVVTQYSRTVAAIDDLYVQGITYPEAEVRVRLQQQGTDDPEEYAVGSDEAGNFIYVHGRDKGRRVALRDMLSAAALFPLLERRYYLSASVIENGAESAATQVFEVIVGGFSTSELLLGLVLAVLLFVAYTTYITYRRRRTL